MLGNQSLLEAFAQQIGDVNEKVDVTLGELRETQVALCPDLPSTPDWTLQQLTIVPGSEKLKHAIRDHRCQPSLGNFRTPDLGRPSHLAIRSTSLLSWRDEIQSVEFECAIGYVAVNVATISLAISPSSNIGASEVQ